MSLWYRLDSDPADLRYEALTRESASHVSRSYPGLSSGQPPDAPGYTHDRWVLVDAAWDPPCCRQIPVRRGACDSGISLDPGISRNVPDQRVLIAVTGKIPLGIVPGPTVIVITPDARPSNSTCTTTGVFGTNPCRAKLYRTRFLGHTFKLGRLA